MRRGVVLPGSPAALVPGIHTHYKRQVILRALLQRASIVITSHYHAVQRRSAA
jgi:hypothetical protein